MDQLIGLRSELDITCADLVIVLKKLGYVISENKLKCFKWAGTHWYFDILLFGIPYHDFWGGHTR